MITEHFDTCVFLISFDVCIFHCDDPIGCLESRRKDMFLLHLSPFFTSKSHHLSPKSAAHDLLKSPTKLNAVNSSFLVGHVKDYLLEDAASVYYALFREMAHLAAWDHQGRYDSFFGPMQKCHVTLMK